MAFWDKFNKKENVPDRDEVVEKMVENEIPRYEDKAFDVGGHFPRAEDIERLAKYRRGRKIFDGKTYDVLDYKYDGFRNFNRNGFFDPTHLYEVYERAEKLLENSPFNQQLHHLYIAVNLIDILIVKPADLMVGEEPFYDSTKEDETNEQKALDRIVEENNITSLIHEAVVGGGIRGDSWVKTYYAYRQDFSALPQGIPVPKGVTPEPIIESVNPSYVFPELSNGSNKKFRAINIAYVEWVKDNKAETPYLNVERHVPGAIVYERFRLSTNGIDNRYGTPIELFKIEERVATNKKIDVVETGVPHPLLFHIPHKSIDDTWQGISSIEKLESVLAAINDRVVQIDFILWKHADPTAYGPPLGGENVQFGGKYIELEKEDPTPGYMVWDAQLEGAFRELELLIGIVFQMSETPQFIFGTTLAGNGNAAGGTSHTTGDAIKTRFFPLISKVKRIRMGIDVAFREALWTAQLLENYANDGVDGYEPYEPQYPKIHWRDGLPRDEKTLAEVYQIRTGGKPTTSVIDAIKALDEVGDVQAKEVIERIKEDEKASEVFVEPSIFRPKPNNDGDLE